MHMVYGINFVPEHGYRVDVEPLDGDVRAITVQDETPDGGLPFLPTIQRSHEMGRPVNTDHIPTKMEWRDSQRHGVPDFDNAFIPNFSTRARAIIEEFEPNIHQFIPVKFLDKKGTFLEDRWFLIVCNRIDSVDRKNTRMELVKGMMWDRGSFTDPKLVFNEGQAAGFHLWRDKHLLYGPYVSNELAAALTEANLTGAKMVRMESV
jgi:hypothetical protein